jgi:hypothetical protein
MSTLTSPSGKAGVTNQTPNHVGPVNPTGITPPRIGDILVDDKGNRRLVTEEFVPGSRTVVDNRYVLNPDGTVTLAPGVRVDRRA